jgi:uncharacterized membrane protein YfcA
VPALLGYYAGQHWRRSLSEQLFRRLFLTGLLLLGAYLAVTKLVL